MPVWHNVLVVHTAFIGDIVLMLPMIRALKRSEPRRAITVIAVPAAAAVLTGNPDITSVLVYDKKGKDRGIAGMFRLIRTIRRRHFDAAVIPHRSARSAVITAAGGIPRRIGFSTSAWRWLYTDVVLYDRQQHESDRDLSLIAPLGARSEPDGVPLLHPSADDNAVVGALLAGTPPHLRVAIAPGSVWNTKRWPEEKFVALGKLIAAAGYAPVLVGGPGDAGLCNRIADAIGQDAVINGAGRLTLLQSAALLARCAVCVSNDSAPMHLAGAVGTPVIALFGATVPAFGFGPRGPGDHVVETPGLPCRPCSIHGGDVCPIRTFECMQRIDPGTVFDAVHALVGQGP